MHLTKTNKRLSSRSLHTKKTKGERNSGALTTTVVSLTPYQTLPDKVKAQLRGVWSLAVGLSSGEASVRGLQGQYITLTTNGNTSYPAQLLLHKSFKENVTILFEDAVCDASITEGDEVTLSTGCECLLAQDVTFSLLSGVDLGASAAFTQYLKEQLVDSGLIISTGMKMTVQYLSQEVILKVVNVKLFGLQVTAPFRFIYQTQLHVENTKELTRTSNEEKCEVSFENIGGCQSELQHLQQQLDVLFSKGSSSVRPAKGILISGPAGSGKSLIVEALRTKYGRKCVTVNLEDVRSRFRGETEQNLSQCFALAASRAPCLILLDDVDVLSGAVGGGSRAGVEAGRGGGGTGVITALLHLLDGITSAASHDIMVVATARQPESIDAALRRPGRLCYDITLPLPDAPARVDILKKLIAGVAHDLGESDLVDLGSRTPGYLGGDLRSVVVEAVMQAGTGPLTRQDLETSLATIKPVSLRDSTTLAAKTKLSDLLGYDTLKSKLQEAVSLTLEHGAVFQQCGLSPPSRFLLFGPPGCGKTAFIRAIASEFHLSVISVKRSTVLGKYFGESEQNLAKIFSQASASAPCVVHFENFEGLAGRKQVAEEGGGTDVESRIINHLKVQLDGVVRSDGIFVFAETSRPDLLNTDLIRPGRFHEYHHVGLPDDGDRHQLLRHHLSSCRLASDVSLESLVQLSRSFTVAEVVQACVEVKQVAQGEDRGPGPTTEGPPVTAEKVAQAMEAVVPSTSLKMCQKYKSFSKIYCSG